MSLPLITAADFAALLREGRPLLDLRAPVEFARGAFPAAQNLPLMTDAERAAVGACYKQQGQQAAVALGHHLVSADVRAQRLQGWVDFCGRHPQGALYCFRGGMRSQIVQGWLADAGVIYPRVQGGYKALRQYLLGVLQEQIPRLNWVVLAGPTGVGKTALLNRLPRQLDLEGLAHHRGSAFGRQLEPQPMQIDFENTLAIRLLQLMALSGPIFVEDESRLIGRCALPAELLEALQSAPLLEVEASLEERVQRVLEEYVLRLGSAFTARYGESGPQRHQQRLSEDLGRIRSRLGGLRYQQLAAQMQRAFTEQHINGSVEEHRVWIRALLRDYYDPMYAHHRQARQERVLAKGRADELLHWVQASLSAQAAP